MTLAAPADFADNALLLDIEGTTTAIAFVTDVLFPYAARAIPDFLCAHGDQPAVIAAGAAIAADAVGDELKLDDRERIVAVVRRQMAGDVKATGLKQLQGLVWEHGYRSGAITGQVYADVPVMFGRWKDAGRPIAIYSSGSILAQKLIFAFSSAGNLSRYLVAHYDTTTGPKREAASYTSIAAQWQRSPGTITFCTDQPAEAHAAAAAGMHAVLLMRPGNAPLPAHQPFAVHADFTAL